MIVASVEVGLVVLVEFGTPVFGRPFVLLRWRCGCIERGVQYSLVVQILLGGGSLGGSPR